MFARGKLIENEICSDRGALLKGAGFLQDVFGEEVLDLGLIADDLVISGLDQLLAAVAKLLTDGLLHAWIFQLPLARGFPGDELYDPVAEDLVAVGVGDHEHSRILAGLELVDGLIGWPIAFQR